MLKSLKQNGQMALEYAVLIIVLIGALLASSFYIKRGLQGRWKAAVDDFGDQYDPLHSAGSSQVHTIDATSVTSIVTQNVTGGVETYRFDDSRSTERRDTAIFAGPRL